jgi:hypothetical protein
LWPSNSHSTTVTPEPVAPNWPNRYALFTRLGDSPPTGLVVACAVGRVPAGVITARLSNPTTPSITGASAAGITTGSSFAKNVREPFS